MNGAVYLLLGFLLLLPRTVYAITDPGSVPNNKFGIHVADTNDIPAVAPLVNSTGGDWGYVTIVIPETDRNTEKWQGIFDAMRRLHLIPIVRLATKVVGEHWSIPTTESLEDWVRFLRSLTWPIENRYVVLFNEPNHAKEWGGKLDPEGFAEITHDLATRLKKDSDEYFIMIAGMDASAPNSKETMNEDTYLTRVFKAKPELTTLIDGLSSHSYPNPNFSGSPLDDGKGSLRTFEWELQYLARLGVNKRLPVFITETGWLHREGKTYLPGLLAPEAVAANIRLAARTMWNDPRVVAVTPFVFNYQDYPFDHFSWKKLGIDEYYPFYTAYQDIPKIKGAPKQREAYRLVHFAIPTALVEGSKYTIPLLIENLGQAIVDPLDEFAFEIMTSPAQYQWSVSDLPIIAPQNKGTIELTLTAPAFRGTTTITMKMRHRTAETFIAEQTVEVIPPPSLQIEVPLGWKGPATRDDATVLLYTDTQKLIHKFTDVPVSDGIITILGLTNIDLSHTYRVVVLIPYYLPRQLSLQFHAGQNVTKTSRFFPIDFDTDGEFTIHDIGAAILTSPKTAFNRLF